MKELNCSGCTNLKEIPNIVGLKDLNCSWCEITTIPDIPGLEYLECMNCKNIKEISNVGLKNLNCSRCSLLTKIPEVQTLDCSNCPWLIQSLENKVKLGLKLQSWIRKNFRYFVFKKWIGSVEGKDFFYDPDNIGGRVEKVKIKKIFENEKFYI